MSALARTVRRAYTRCRVITLCLVLVASADCGGGRTPLGRTPLESDPSRVSQPPLPEGPCEPVGSKRAGRPTDEYQYCVCEKDGGWTCYGPNPSKVETKRVRCGSVLEHPTLGVPESCLYIWSNCTSGRTYTVSCIDGFCWCLVNNESMAELEPRTKCPRTPEEVNTSCGWNLDMP
jgi:hypothetical protein